MIDLHMHSVHSDGTNTVIELLQQAEKLKLDMISITDHETCKAHFELRNIDVKKYYSGKIIPGVEVKGFYKGRVIDILGYNIDIEKMEKWLTEFYENRTFEIVQTKYMNKYYEICKKLGIKLTPREELEWNPKKEWASPFLHKEITKYEENRGKIPNEAWDDFNTFRHCMCYNPESEFYIDKSEDFPSLKTCIQSIKDAGGKAFLAHAYIYKWAKDKAAFINDIIENYGIDGIECYYSQFTDEQTKYVLELCKKKNLLMSGGSDYHGLNKKDISLGIGKGNLQIPNDIIVWSK